MDDALFRGWGAEGAEVVRLHPLRVLVLSPDRAFRAMCATLLARRDCAAFTAATVSEARELWAGEPIDVLVLERCPFEQGFAAVLAWGRTGDPHACPEPDGRQRRAPAAIVIVGDDYPQGGRTGSPDEIPELPKWARFEEIYAAIAKADRRRVLPPAAERRGWPPQELTRLRGAV